MRNCEERENLKEMLCLGGVKVRVVCCWRKNEN